MFIKRVPNMMGDNEIIKFNVIVEEAFKEMLLNMLPAIPTIITKVDINDTNKFSVELRTNCLDKESALKWKDDFQKQSHNSFNIDSTYNENTPKTIFKRTYHCLHNTRPPSRVKTPHYKHVNCSAKLTINVKNPQMKRSKDVYLKDFPCVIFIRYTHNHNILSADVLRYRKPTEDIESKFRELFGKGHSPSSALEIFKMNLQQIHLENYYQVAADGSKCPTRRWCYELYYNIFKKQYGDPSGPEMISAMAKSIEKYNEECRDNCAAMSSDDENLVIAVCSPMMKRVHQYLKSSSEIMFIDSSGNMDRHNSRVFLMLCPSVVGALPVGLIITYSESEKAISKGLDLYKSLLEVSAFYRNLYPNVIITDDSTAERQSLTKCFPSSKLLLCQFHILQATMRYLWDSKHGVHKDDRAYIYKLFNKLVKDTVEKEFLSSYEYLLNCEITQKYKNVVNYFKNLKNRSIEWALCYRNKTITRGNNTNNYAEASFRVLKDKILHRTKAFSIVQMFSFLTENLQSYYTQKITDIINNRTENLTRSKYYISPDKIKDFKYEQMASNLYKVISNDNEYFVNIENEICTCYVGNSGAPCKHQYGVVKTFNLTSQQFVPTADVKLKSVLHKIMDNNVTVNSWYASLKPEDNIPQKNTSTLEDDLQNNNSINVERNDTEQPSSSTTAPKFNVEEVENERRLLLQNFQLLNQKLLKDPDVFLPAVKKFNELFSTIKTDSSMTSALHTFGKYVGAAQPVIKAKKNLQGGRTIGVQPTAISRRKIKLGGRNSVFSGRPPLNKNDHIYSRKRRLNVGDIPVPRKKAAPHSLTFCADHNINLGTHH